ncbi:hypothetical protein Q7P35_004648 [Cladosporium inversicolor]
MKSPPDLHGSHAGDQQGEQGLRTLHGICHASQSTLEWLTCQINGRSSHLSLHVTLDTLHFSFVIPSLTRPAKRSSRPPSEQAPFYLRSLSPHQA